MRKNRLSTLKQKSNAPLLNLFMTCISIVLPFFAKYDLKSTKRKTNKPCGISTE